MLAIFRINFQKNDIISDAIIPNFDCAKFHVKSYFLLGFTQESHYVSPLRAWSDKNIPRQIGLSKPAAKNSRLVF